MTPLEVTVLSVVLNAAGIVPSASNRFPLIARYPVSVLGRAKGGECPPIRSGVILVVDSRSI
jgi:hypothetical protein